MVTVKETKTDFIFEINGLLKILALTDEIIVPKRNLINAYQNKQELNNKKGTRLGTHIPFLITAGFFTLKDKVNFWYVRNKNNTIIVELANNFFDKLYIEVKNPTEIMLLLNSK